MENYTPEDNVSRIAAIQSNISCIVQAPAGSGKTELLVRRFLNLLACVKEPEEILAITFTNKAAAEMKQRVLRYLKENDNSLSADIRSLVLSVRKRNDERKWNIYSRPNRLRIMTMDSFNRLLVSQLPITSGTGVPTNIIENPTSLYRQAALSAITEIEEESSIWKEPAASIITHHHTNIAKVIELLEEILSRRDQWMRYIQADINSSEFRSLLESFWGFALNTEVETIVELLSHYDNWLALCESLHYASKNINKNNVLDVWNIDIPSSPQTATIEHWRSLATFIFTSATSKRDIRKRFTKTEGYPKEHAETATHLKHLLEFTATVREDRFLFQQLVRFPELPDQRFSDNEWQLIYSTNRILPLAVAELRLLFRERAVTDFIEIAQGANQALGVAEQPTNLALSLDSQISHLLVDEYQDTSLGQFELIERLVEEWEPDGHRTVFLVGDPMQSIYRFRKAEVGIFLSSWNNGIANIRLTRLHLTVNFRSNANIVAWVNQAFCKIMPNTSRPAYGEVAFNASTSPLQSMDLDSHVIVHGICDQPASAVARSVLETIQSAIQDHPEKTCAVLVRGRNELVDLIPLLRSNHIPYSAIEIESLEDRLVIRDLLSLSKILLSPADDLAYLSLLRSPFCGLTLADLTVLRADRKQPVWLALSELSIESRLSSDGTERALYLYNTICDAWGNRDEGPFRDLLEKTWRSLGGYDLADDFDKSNADEFFNLLSTLGPGRPSVELLVEQISRLRATPKMTDTQIHLLTIHRAKGLEWDIVILPALHRGSSSDKDSFMMWHETQDLENRKILLQAPSPSTKEKSIKLNSKHHYLKSIERQKANQESARLLYVACTRARYKLHLFGLAKTKEKKILTPRVNTFLHMLWPTVNNSFKVNNAPIDTTENVSEPPEPSNLLTRRKKISTGKSLFPTATTAPIPSQEVEYSWAGEIAKRTGIVIHRVIQHLASQQREGPVTIETNQDDWIQYLLRNQSIDHNNMQSALQYCRKALRNMQNDEVFHWIISPDHSARNFEWPVTHYLNQSYTHYVIDCTFIDDQNVRWIIDFKTGSHSGTDVDSFLNNEVVRYQAQLEQYAKILNTMESRKIKLGLYFPMLKSFRSWSFN